MSGVITLPGPVSEKLLENTLSAQHCFVGLTVYQQCLFVQLHTAFVYKCIATGVQPLAAQHIHPCLLYLHVAGLWLWLIVTMKYLDLFLTCTDESCMMFRGSSDYFCLLIKSLQFYHFKHPQKHHIWYLHSQLFCSCWLIVYSHYYQTSIFFKSVFRFLAWGVSRFVLWCNLIVHVVWGADVGPHVLRSRCYETFGGLKLVLFFRKKKTNKKKTNMVEWKEQCDKTLHMKRWKRRTPEGWDTLCRNALSMK